MFDIRLRNGTLDLDINEFFPFMSDSATTSQTACNAHALENENNPGEYLFLESAGFAVGTYWFGALTDAPHPNNVAGVALDAPAGGHSLTAGQSVHIQTTGKLLPDIISDMELSCGKWYSPGSDGSLAPYTGASPAVALAVGTHDFVFTGPAVLPQ